MEITISKNPVCAAVSISGSLDAVTSVEAESKLMGLVAENSNIAIDLAKLDYISSAGLRVLLALAKKVQEQGGKLVLSSLSQQVKEVFDISGFTSIFQIFDNKEDSWTAFKG